MKQSAIFVVTEPTLDAAAAVPPHQLKNGGAPMVTWWLPGLSFSADTVLSAQHQQVFGKLILNCRHWVQSLHSYSNIFARTKRQPCVWVPPIPKSNLWESARIPFMQTLLTQCPCAHMSPDPNAIVNVYIYDGTGIEGIWLISTGCMMTSSNGNIFRVTGHLCGEFTGPRWIPRTKASDEELWCFLWSVPE